MSAWGDRIKSILTQPGLSQASLARACKVAPPTVSDWVNDVIRMISGDNLVAAARYLGVSPEWLMTGRTPDGWNRGAPEVARPSPETILRAHRFLLTAFAFRGRDYDLERESDLFADAYAYLDEKLEIDVSDSSNLVDFGKWRAMRLE